MKRTLFAVLTLVVGTVFGQEAPEPVFDWMGSVSQKATFSAPEWAEPAEASWLFTTALKPRFSYGPATFQADTTWTLPLTASLAPSPVQGTVSEAYFRIRPLDSLDLTFGQKRFSLGVGQTFTVGDSINPVVGFFDQKTGFRGATAEWSPVSWASVSAALSTDGNPPGTVGTVDTLGGAVQLSLLLDQLQLTVSTVARPEASLNPAVGLSYDLFGIILTAEGAAEFLPQGVRPSGPIATWKTPDKGEDPRLSGSTGARWTLTLGDWDLTLAGEYLHWAQGWNNKEAEAWKAALGTPAEPLARQVRQASPLQSQENAFARISLGTGGTFSLNAFAAFDLQDQSVLAQSSVVWAPWDNLDLTASIQTADGDPGSAWEALPPWKTAQRYQASFATTYHF